MKNYIGAYVINLESNEDRKKLFLEDWNNLDDNRINFVKAFDTRGNLWENYKQHISEKYPMITNKIVTINNGLNNELFSYPLNWLKYIS